MNVTFVTEGRKCTASLATPRFVTWSPSAMNVGSGISTVSSVGSSVQLDLVPELSREPPLDQ